MAELTRQKVRLLFILLRFILTFKKVWAFCHVGGKLRGVIALEVDQSSCWNFQCSQNVTPNRRGFARCPLVWVASRSFSCVSPHCVVARGAETLLPFYRTKTQQPRTAILLHALQEIAFLLVPSVLRAIGLSTQSQQRGYEPCPALGALFGLEGR